MIHNYYQNDWYNTYDHVSNRPEISTNIRRIPIVQAIKKYVCIKIIRNVIMYVAMLRT